MQSLIELKCVGSIKCMKECVVYIYVCVHVFACVCVEEWVRRKKFFLISFYIGLHMVVHVKAYANMQLVFVQKVVTINIIVTKMSSY